MNIDKKIKLAENIFKKVDNCQRNEWIKWAIYFRENEWDKSLKLANYLKNAEMLGFAQKHSYIQIFNAIVEYQNELQNYTLRDILEIFGFIDWKLVILESKKKQLIKTLKRFIKSIKKGNIIPWDPNKDKIRITPKNIFVFWITTKEKYTIGIKLNLRYKIKEPYHIITKEINKILRNWDQNLII